MTVEEYTKWKSECPDEWHEVFQEVLKEFIKGTYMSGLHGSDVLFTTIGNNGVMTEYTVKRVGDALINENDCCDELIRKHKQSIDYKTNKQKQNVQSNQ